VNLNGSYHDYGFTVLVLHITRDANGIYVLLQLQRALSCRLDCCSPVRLWEVIRMERNALSVELSDATTSSPVSVVCYTS